MSEPLTVIAYVRAKKGQESSLRKVLQGLIAPSRAEKGCVDYEMHESLEGPGRFAFVATWASEAHLQDHMQTPHIQAMLRQSPELIDGPIEITRWKRAH